MLAKRFHFSTVSLAGLTGPVSFTGFAGPVLAVALLAAPASAAEATAAGARALADDLAAYIGRPAIDDGYVTVMPDGEAYRITLELGRVTAKLLADAPMTLTVFDNPALKAAPLPGGLWRVTDVVLPSFALRGKEGDEIQSIEYRFGTGTTDAVFDPALGAFTRFDQTLPLVSSRTESEFDVTVEQRDIAVALEAGAGPNGGVDVNGTLRTAEIVEDFTFPDGTAIRAVLGGIDQVLMIEGIRSRAALDLVAFLVAHGDAASIAAEQTALKAAVDTLLPGFRRMYGDARIERIAVSTPIGDFTGSGLRAVSDFAGAVDDARFAFSIALDELELPALPIPEWAGALVPTGFSLGAAIEHLDLDTPARLLLAQADFSRDPPLDDADGEAAGRSIFPGGTIHMVLETARFGNDLYEATVEARAAVTDPGLAPGGGTAPAGEPPEVEADATVTLSNIDAVFSRLQSAAQEPELADMIPALIFARGLARTGENGEAVWQVAVAKNGSVSVNGQMLVPPSR